MIAGRQGLVASPILLIDLFPTFFRKGAQL